MLPSFRLIAATFLCGFFVVFAGLRLAASLNDIHEGLPVMAAHAAPVSITPVADREARRSLAAVPVMYDMRFVISTVAPTLVRVPPTAFDHLVPPLSIIPSEDIDSESSPEAVPEANAANEAAEPDTAVATIQPAAPVAPESAIVPDAAAEPPAPAVAAIDAQDRPDATPAEPSAPETEATATQATVNEPQATPAPAVEEFLPSSEPGAAPAEIPAAPGPKPRSPAAALPAPKPQAAKSSPRARVKVARKKHVRVARRAAPANSPANSFGSFNGALATLPGTAQR